VVLDITSIKKVPRDAMKKYVSESCLVIPTHPMW
jgi:prephenate dehydrogenase